MKKMMAAAMTGVMVLAVGVQAAAAPSITGGGAQQGDIPAGQVMEQPQQTEAAAQAETQAEEQPQIGTLEGVVVEPLEEGTVTWTDIPREKYTEEQLQIIDNLNNASAEMTVKDAFAEMVDLSAMKVLTVAGAEMDRDVQQLVSELKFLSPVWELNFDGVEPTKENPVICTFTVNNMTEDMEVFVLYDCPEDGWELLETERGEDNQIKVSIHSGSAPTTLVYRQADGAAGIPAGTSPVAQSGESEAETETADAETETDAE